MSLRSPAGPPRRLKIERRGHRRSVLAGVEEGGRGAPLVTVGLITYNRAWSLPEVLDALASIEYDPKLLRLVFVDKDSTDGTRSIIDGFVAKHDGRYGSMEVISSQSGIPGARNICIARAAGADYLFFLDSDVVPGPDALKRLLSHFRDPSVGMASLPYDSENSRGKLGVLVNAFDTPTGAADAWKVAAGCTLLRMEMVDRVGRFCERLRVLEDGEYSYRVKKAGYRIVCDFGYPAGHLRKVQMGASSYIGFARDSADFYAEMAKDGSGIYIGRFVLSAALLVFAAAFLVGLGVLALALLLGALAVSVGLNSSDRLWGDGSRIKMAYKPLMGLVITAATVFISLYSLERRLSRARPQSR